LTGQATDKAVNGVYNIKVERLAAAEQIATVGMFSSVDSEITQGDISFRVSAGKDVKVTVDESNNSLAGLVESINSSGADVTASIINDGSTGGTPFRLLITSQTTGATNSISVANNLTDSGGNATKPVFEANPVQAGTNARVILGSGIGEIPIESETNEVTGTIPNVNSRMNRLSSLGLSFDANNKISIDSGRLNEVLNGKAEGVTLNDVARLFALDGSSTN